MSAMIFSSGRSNASLVFHEYSVQFSCSRITFLKGFVFLRGLDYLQLLLASRLASIWGGLCFGYS